MAVHTLLTLAETAAGYVFACECGAHGEPDPDRQSAFDAFVAHAEGLAALTVHDDA